MVLELLSITLAASDLLVIRVLSVGIEITSVVDGLAIIHQDSDAPHTLAEVGFH